MADQMTNEDVNKLLEKLKEHADNTYVSGEEDEKATQTPVSVASSDEELRALLKEHFSEEQLSKKSAAIEDYSFDSEGFVDESELEEETAEEFEEELEEEFEEESESTAADALSIEIIEEEPEEIVEEEPEIQEETEEFISNEAIIDEIVEDIVEQTREDVVDEVVEDIVGEKYEEELEETEEIEEIEEAEACEDDEEFKQVLFTEILEEANEEASEKIEEESEIAPVSYAVEETVIKEESEIEDESEPEEEYEAFAEEQIFEEAIDEEDIGEPIDISELERETDLGEFDTLLEESELVAQDIQDQEEITELAENQDEPYGIAADGENSTSSEYFENGETEDLDASDIALMMALGGEDELTQTMGFEKIRQAVNEYDGHDDSGLSQRDIYAYDGKEFTSYEQASEIKNRYGKEKINVIIRLFGTAILALILLIYETVGWLGVEFDGIFDIAKNPAIHILAALQLLFLCAAISYKRIIKTAKDIWSFSSVIGVSSIALIVINIINDVCLMAFVPQNAAMIYHSVPAILLLVSICYDAFEIFGQDGAFEIVSREGKKHVFEPYGKIKIGDDGAPLKEEIIDRDSYFASGVSFVDRYFARTSDPRPQSVAHVISVIAGLAASLVLMLVLVLCSKPFGDVLSGFVISVSVALFCASVLSGDFAFFVAYKKLKKIKTAIIGKAAALEYGSCDLVYFDDVDVFDAKSVKTKGLKLYDNNEIYRVLYHTQAVFSRIGGPLRSVFEYATTEMAHSRNVAIKEITGEGVSALVDGKTPVLIGSGSFMKSQGLSPRYTSADIKCEEAGEESIMFIALGGVVCAKLYVNYKFSRNFERVARKLMARGVNIGIRSADPNVNMRWANKLTRYKKTPISVVKPALKELCATKDRADSGIVSALSSRAAIEALIMCIRLREFEGVISKLRICAVAVGVLLSLVLLIASGINAVTLLVMALYSAAVTSAMILLSYLYTKR